MHKFLIATLFFLVMLFASSLSANSFNTKTTVFIIVSDSLQIGNDSMLHQKNSCCAKKTILIDSLKKKKFVSALFACPFPFGFMGAHRVMLGTKSWVPIVYVVTFGGCFGLLPLIDCCVILCSKNIEQYENNPNVFMWIK